MTVHLSSIASVCFLPRKQEELAIFCVGQDLRRVAALRAWAAHRRLELRSLIGSYNGLTEMRFALVSADYAEVAPWTKAEESILLLDSADQNGERPAKLVFADGRVEDLGRFVSCSRYTALASPSWTYDPAAGKYFICVDDRICEHAVLTVPCAQTAAHSTAEATS